ncbi:intein-containing DNA-dependent RNA polymerase 2 subunit Rpb2/subunit Rpb4 precursor [Yasminevirus sp. GU-2018]|uniref:DNA-directed RNA polymerase n=1 Tax=Yasminevirus sp. GU-2018 TaxID=2420051 RepID=A0A5K0U870_9VIRU|nr:intein-containing DNA-dependent RNA polymerase 2 subunit Rpb2/subunit Rpb4 precursor [Yasminevirus sp. GU-2018]
MGSCIGKIFGRQGYQSHQNEPNHANTEVDLHVRSEQDRTSRGGPDGRPCQLSQTNQNNYKVRTYDYLVRMLMLGDVKAGKSTFLQTAVGNVKPPFYTTTVGIDFGVTTIEQRGKQVKLQIWDTSGDPRFTLITQSYIRGASVVLVFYRTPTGNSIYDEVNKAIKESVDQKIENIERYGDDYCLIVVIGNTPGGPFRKLEDYKYCRREIRHYAIDVDTKAQVDDLINDLDIVTTLRDAIDRSRSTAKKPAIYIYGPKGTTVDVELKTEHQITLEIPKRTRDVWRCELVGDGGMYVDNPDHINAHDLFRLMSSKKYIGGVRVPHISFGDDKFMKPPPDKTIGIKNGQCDELIKHGYIPKETLVTESDVIFGKVTPINDNVCGGQNGNHIDTVLDRVYMETKNQDSYETRKALLRSERYPHVGDMFCSRSGQIGTIGTALKPADAPFTESGDDRTIYPYLYWEAYINPVRIGSLKTLGTIVFKKTEYDALDKILRRYLNTREADEFREYWERIILKQPKPYVKADFVDQPEFEREFPLRIKTDLDVASVMRLECVFSFHTEVDGFTTTDPEKLHNLYKRIEPRDNQISIVEWGGMVL